MSKISSSIELRDNFTQPMLQVISAVQSAVNVVEELAQSMDSDIDVSSFNKVHEYMNNATASVVRFKESLDGIDGHIQENTAAQGNFNSALKEGTGDANKLMSTIKKAVLAYASFRSVKAVIGLSDELTSMTARLDLMNDGLQTTEELQEKIFASAERSRGSYLATADAVSKLGLMAGEAFNSSEEIIAFTEQLNKQFTIAGTSAEGIDAAMLQLTQAMGSGILRGEEYNSVLEQAPNIIQAIADYMDVPKGQLKDMASEGQITAEIVKNALFAAAEDTNAKFESMPKTFAQAWQSFQNQAIMIFSPVLKQLNRIVNNEGFNQLVNGIMTGLSALAVAALATFNLIATIGGFVANNWALVAPVVYLVAAALAVYYGRLAMLWALEKARFAFQKASKAIEVAMAVAAYGLATARGAEASATAAAIAAQLGLNAAMYACPITWIVAGIAAVVAIFYTAVAAVNKFAGTSISATGIIAGTFAALGAHILNVFISIQNAIAAFVNFFANVFSNPVASVKILFLDLLTFITKIVRQAAGIIEKLVNIIPGVKVDITSQLDSKIDALKDERQTTIEQSGYKEYITPLEQISASDAYSRWYERGSSLFKRQSAETAFANDMTNKVSDIAKNTGKTADNTAIAEEDLKYLRDIAEQEVINRYTTAQINVDMSGMKNTVNNNGDLDGFVSSLTEAVNEAAESMAEGTHR